MAKTAKSSKPMTKSQIMSTLAEKCDMTKKDVQMVIEEMVNLAYKEAKRGFTIPGLGKLVVQQRKARMGRNPATGEQIKIPAKKVLKFRIAKAAKDAILPAKK
jgi:DNA-binding protein HU-beta